MVLKAEKTPNGPVCFNIFILLEISMIIRKNKDDRAVFPPIFRILLLLILL